MSNTNKTKIGNSMPPGGEFILKTNILFFLLLNYRGCVGNLKTWVPLYGDFKISWVPSWVPNASFSKFVGAMAPLAPMLTHPLLYGTEFR